MLLTVLLVAVVKIYQAKHNFPSAHKASFNIIMLALTLFLGLNFFVSAKSLASLNISPKGPSANATYQEAFKELANVLKTSLSGWAVTKDEKRFFFFFFFFFLNFFLIFFRSRGF